MRNIGSKFEYREVVNGIETFRYETKILMLYMEEHKSITEIDITSCMVSSVTIPREVSNVPDFCKAMLFMVQRSWFKSANYIPPGGIHEFHVEVW